MKRGGPVTDPPRTASYYLVGGTGIGTDVGIFQASLAAMDAKNTHMQQMMKLRISTITPHLVHAFCTALNCSTLSNFLYCQAHSLPFAPRTKIMTKFTQGMRHRSPSQT